MKIDIHAHYVPRDCFEMKEGDGQVHGPLITADPSGQEFVEMYGFKLGPIARQLYDPETRVKDMNQARLDMQAVSLSPTNFFYHLDPQLSLKFCRRANDGLAELVRAYPDRFVGLADVPLQDAGLAAAELERAVKQLGFKGVQINSNINGHNLDEPVFFPFYEKSQELGVPIFIHPHYVVGQERMKKYYLTNLIGNPVDTTIAVASLIFGGVLEKFPRLKFVFAHAGGCAPYIKGRWDHAYRHGYVVKFDIPKPPSEYIKTLYFDTIAHYGPALSYLVGNHGADRVVLGSDYPFDMADPDSVAAVSALSISAEDKDKIMWGNAADLLGL
ncbi:MAG: amidohydrolase family protein [Pseudomonadota bacterium]